MLCSGSVSLVEECSPAAADVPQAGFEPATPDSVGRCSIPLSYKGLERLQGPAPCVVAEHYGVECFYKALGLKCCTVSGHIRCQM